jgi:hypothetical protein
MCARIPVTKNRPSQKNPTTKPGIAVWSDFIEAKATVKQTGT